MPLNNSNTLPKTDSSIANRTQGVSSEVYLSLYEKLGNIHADAELLSEYTRLMTNPKMTKPRGYENYIHDRVYQLQADLDELITDFF